LNEKQKKSVIVIEIDRKEKAKWVRAASDHRLKLITFIRAKVNGEL